MKDAHHKRLGFPQVLERRLLRREANTEIIETAAHHADPGEAWLERQDDWVKSELDELSDAFLYDTSHG